MKRIHSVYIIHSKVQQLINLLTTEALNEWCQLVLPPSVDLNVPGIDFYPFLNKLSFCFNIKKSSNF